MKINFRSLKTQLIIFLVLFIAFLAVKDRDLYFPAMTAAAVFFAAGIEALILSAKSKKPALTESSLITGLILGFVLSGDNHWWVFLFASFLAIGSKYLIRSENRHIFNPAAFGIFLVTILCGATTQWKGTYYWFILLPFGLYFSYRMRKLEILLSYLAVAFALFGIQAYFMKIQLLNIIWFISYFFVSIMLIEPKTTPVKIKPKLLFGSGASTLVFTLTALGVRFDAELCSLLLFNMLVLKLGKLSERRV